VLQALNHSAPVLEILILDKSLKEPLLSPRIGVSLAALVTGKSSLKSLSVAGGYSEKTILPLVKILALNNNDTSLAELNISNNGIGDVLASILAAFLRLNKTLVNLKFDGNRISFTGWQSIASSFTYNTTLLLWQFPWKDYETSLSSLPASKQTKLRSMLLGIEIAVANNREKTKNPGLLTRFNPLVLQAPTSVIPLAAVPKELLKDSQNEWGPKAQVFLKKQEIGLPSAEEEILVTQQLPKSQNSMRSSSSSALAAKVDLAQKNAANKQPQQNGVGAPAKKDSEQQLMMNSSKDLPPKGAPSVPPPQKLEPIDESGMNAHGIGSALFAALNSRRMTTQTSLDLTK